MIKIFAEVTLFIADVRIVKGEVSPLNQKIDNKYVEERTVYDGEDPQEVKNSFIEAIAGQVQSRNVEECNKVLFDRTKKTYRLWVVTDIY